MTFTISAPPHRKSKITFKTIMWSKVLALVPVSLVSVYFFGLPALSIILAGILAAVVTEAGIQKMFRHKITINDGNAVLIGLMLSLIMPPEAPIWLPVVGSFFAISIGKHAFGGIGSYVFNPVLAAWKCSGFYERRNTVCHEQAIEYPCHVIAKITVYRYQNTAYYSIDKATSLGDRRCWSVCGNEKNSKEYHPYHRIA